MRDRRALPGPDRRSCRGEAGGAGALQGLTCGGRSPMGVAGGELREPAAPPRLREQHLQVADPRSRKPASEKARQKLQSAPEALVVAELLEPASAASKRAAPVRERQHVAGADVVEPDRPHVRLARERALDRLDRRQAAAGEDQLVGEAPRRASRPRRRVVDHDRLEEEEPVRAQQLRAAAEVGVELLPADRLDHLDRDELVVACPRGRGSRTPSDGDAVARGPRRATRASRVVALLARDRRRRHPAAVARGGVHREAAPAGADLEQVVVAGAARAAADPVELRALRLLERLVAGVEERATSTSSSRGRGRARTSRCRGRSGRRCCGARRRRVLQHRSASRAAGPGAAAGRGGRAAGRRGGCRGRRSAARRRGRRLSQRPSA